MNDRNFLQENDEAEEEDYRFLKETHKRPPIKMRTVVTVLLLLVSGAVLFGVISANVFLAIVERSDQSKSSQISLPEDPEVEETEEEAAPSQTPPPMTPAAPEGEKSEEELKAFALENYEYLNARMKETGTKAQRYMVRVAGIRSREDWLNETDISVATQAGLIVADNGRQLLILTDYALIDGAERIVVTFADGSIYDAAFQKRDPITNLAVITIAAKDISEETRESFTIASLGNSYRISTGDSVIAIGSPLGYSGSIGYGEVTSTGNTISVVDGEYNLITTTIQGSSTGSGLLINTQGEVVGLIFQKYASQNNSVITGVPISLLKHLIELLSNNGTLTYAGFRGETVTENVAASAGLVKGVYVTAVEADSPALAAGLAVGDVIQKFDDIDTTSMKLIHTKLGMLSVGDTVSVTVQRLGADGYKQFEFKMTIGEI